MLEMVSAIEGEFRKALFKKRFWLLFGILAVIAPAFQVMSAWFATDRIGGSFLDQGNTLGDVVNQIASPYNLARNNLGGTWQVMLLVIAAIIGLFLIGEERNFKMWKTILVAQPDRLKIIVSKFLTAMLMVGTLLFGGLLGSLLLGALAIALGLATGFSGDWGTLLGLYFLQWLVMAAPIALSFLASWFIAAPGLAVVVVVVLPAIAEGIVRGLVLFRANPISPLNAPFQMENIKNLQERLPKFFFTPNINLGTRLLANDAGSALGNNSPFGQGLGFGTFTWPEIWWSVAVCAVYFALFAGLMLWSFGHRDIHE